MSDGQALTQQAQVARETLEERLRVMPIPAAPPRYPSGTALGVNLLDAALNANHIVRRAEHVTIVDRTHLVRNLSIRVSLDRLTPAQRNAGLRYGLLKEPTNGVGQKPPLIWVPITMVSRSTAAPVRIYDNEQREVPRATQTEILPLVNAALYSLLRVVLEADPDAQDDGEALHQLLYATNRARWLLETAITSMLYDHAHVDDGLVPRPYPTATRDGGSARARRLALEIVDRYLGENAAFLEILHHCSTEIVVVAGLLPSKKEHYLSYETPALPAVKTRASIVPWGRQFTFRYQTYLPPSLDTYHATIESGPGIRIREAVLTTGDGRSRCQELASCLRQLAEMATETRGRGSPTTFAEYELGGIVAHLDEMATNRLDSWRVYRDHWNDRNHMRPPLQPGVTAPAGDLLELNRTLCQAREDDYRCDLSSSGWSGAALDEMAAVVDRLDLGTDLAVDDDPRANTAHMYWKRGRPGDRRARRRAVPVSIHVALVDDSPTFLGSVASWLGALCVLVFFVGVALFGHPDWLLPWSAASVDVGDPTASDGSPAVEIDPLVAVLLIVPTLLLARLELPSGSTLVGRLRTLDRWAAHGAIAVMAAIALTVATRLASPWAMSIVFTRGLYLLLGLFLVTGVDLYVGRQKGKRSSGHELDLPGWVRDRSWWHRARRYDAEFEGIGWRVPEAAARRLGRTSDGGHG